MDHLASCRDREEEEAEAEADASNNSSPSTSTPREISFMPAAASSSSSAAAAASTSASGASSSGAAAAELPVVEKEHMFDKVVTPSDVGKLNRLVIPKQYAEKYFPLGSAPGSEKGLLLTFEDTSSSGSGSESGSGNSNKHWRFRYSYWNSSQSYVMTKGWSRFVKEKRLVAGDTVSFSRGASAADKGRLFIDWKRRVDARGPLLRFPHTLMPLAAPWASFGAGAGGGFFMPPAPPATLYEHHRLRQGGLDFRATMSGMTYPPPTVVGRQQQLLFFGSARTMMPPLHQPPRAPPALPLHYAVQVQPSAAAARPLVLDSVPAIESPTTAAKRVRLFGVNLDNNPRSSGGAGEASSHQQQSNNNALSLQTMPSAGWQQQRTLRLLELPRHGHGGGAESSAASSPSSSSSSKREARSSALDLDL